MSSYDAAKTYGISRRTSEKSRTKKMKIDKFNGPQSKLAVKVCGNLSDIENPDDRNKEHYEATSSEYNKNAKQERKVHSKKEKKAPIKISRNIVVKLLVNHQIYQLTRM
ncbi:unnamed protein product [Parnassius apollo]|uniref:(apollo) hypothetical protein n=1 Tax=Parnassius apollo TaxID=110799 RepID=A0A8S3WJE1_PARAO|nr:unnamed protein product [Parnassius apollo]